GSDAMSEEAIASRLQPVADFVIEDKDAPKTLLSAKQVYENTCSACHDSGTAGAPKFGDEDDWGPLISEGYDALLEVALNGKGAMPGRGGHAALSECEVEGTMVYKASAGRASVDEPEETKAENGDDAENDEANEQANQHQQAVAQTDENQEAENTNA